MFELPHVENHGDKTCRFRLECPMPSLSRPYMDQTAARSAALRSSLRHDTPGLTDFDKCASPRRVCRGIATQFRPVRSCRHLMWCIVNFLVNAVNAPEPAPKITNAPTPRPSDTTPVARDILQYFSAARVRIRVARSNRREICRTAFILGNCLCYGLRVLATFQG